METLRNRISVKLVTNAKDYATYISNPSFVSQKIFSKNFVAIHKIKSVSTLNKPVYVGLSILNLSKLLMYEFHYKYIKSKLDANLSPAVTGSSVYEIKTEDVYEDFYKDKNLFDFSDYSLNSNFFDPVNRKVIGKMKDKFKGSMISEFVGLKNMYSLIAVDNEEVKEAKGVNKYVVGKIRHKKFVDVLFNKEMVRHKMKIIQSKLHGVGKLRLMMFSKFDSLVLMIKDIH